MFIARGGLWVFMAPPLPVLPPILSLCCKPFLTIVDSVLPEPVFYHSNRKVANTIGFGYVCLMPTPGAPVSKDPSSNAQRRIRTPTSQQPPPSGSEGQHASYNSSGVDGCGFTEPLLASLILCLAHLHLHFQKPLICTRSWVGRLEFRELSLDIVKSEGTLDEEINKQEL